MGEVAPLAVMSFTPFVHKPLMFKTPQEHAAREGLGEDRLGHCDGIGG
jgi:hypothetical protein